jgi:hemoglobin/transferrin/lactoferrin receptor protein
MLETHTKAFDFMPRRPGFFSAPAAPIAACVFLFAGSAAAAELESVADETIDQIVVVAHKDERSVREIAANVTVLTRAELKDNLALSVADVFQYVPGVDYEAAGTRFGTEGINIRGIGGNRVAILVDGVPLPDQFDVGSFSNATRDFIDTGLISGIEVLHGPASALYGSAAIGGVVAVRTPDPVELVRGGRVGGDLLATYRGADDSYHGQATLGLGDESAGLLLGASWREGHETDAAAAPSGIDTRDYERRTALVKFVADNRWGQTLRASVIHQEAATLSDLNSMLGTGRFRSTTALEGDDDYRMDVISLAWEFGSPESWIDSGVVRAFYETAEIRQATLDERGNARTPVSIDRFFAFDQEIRGVEINLWKQISGAAVSHRLGVGFEYRDRDTEEYRDGLQTNLETGEQTNVLLGEEFPLRDFPISRTTEMGAFIEDTMSVGDWTIIVALRADRFELTPEQDPMYLEDYPFAELVSLDESDVSPKLGLIYNITPGTDIYLQYSHGFRAPPYADANIGLDIPFFNYRAIPNPDLKSESSEGFDLGVRWQGLSASARLSVFQTRYKDFIESKMRIGTDPVSGRILFQSQNLRATEIEGIEAGWAMNFGAVWFDAAAFYARGENKDNGQPLNSVGPAQAVIGFGWNLSANSQLRLKTTITDAWDDRDESRGELFKPARYAVVDLFLTQRLGERATLRAGLHNLTDKTYWHWADVGGLSPDDPMLPYLSRAGRSASISLNVSW